jgi:alpha-D-ribose 1-methylphosphonate 5-triphosphate synthase subunit PhnG
MILQAPASDLPPRASWVRLLMAADRRALLACARELGGRYAVRHRAAPQAGLHLLQVRDGAFGEPYFLGEIPTAAAQVAVRASDGVDHPGAAWVMADDAELAQAIAVIDAVLSAGLPHQEAARRLLEQGRAACAREGAVRAHMLERTTVDFSLLSETDDADADHADEAGASGDPDHDRATDTDHADPH